MKQIAMICGSLRKHSTNAGILRAIIQAKDPRFKFNSIDIKQFPVFNQDIEQKGYPESIEKARRQVGQSDAILFAVPQYNLTIASPLKNAYDWLSRQDKNKFCPVIGKVGAMVSSGGYRGGGGAQEHFRISVMYRKVQLLAPSKQAQIMVKRFSGNFFDQEGNLIDLEYRKRIPLFLNQFAKFIETHKK